MMSPPLCADALRTALMCGIALVLASCGRVGFELLPADGGLPIVDDCPTTCDNPHGTADCSGGACQIACESGYADCDGDRTNGCEADLSRDVDSCGACGQACTNEGGSTECVAGRCEPTCAIEAADCDGEPENGCEVDLTSPQSCGACDTVCDNPNGSVRCGSTTCAPVCSTGFGDCDGDPQNGCEADLGGASVCPVACDLAGSFALKLTFASTWPSTLLVSSGSGTFVFRARLDLSDNGASGSDTTLSGSIVPCGQAVPDFRSSPLINERYGLIYPASLFAGNAVSLLPAEINVSRPYPGADLTLARTGLLYGVTLPDPIEGAWPSASALQSADTDADGNRGLTAMYKDTAGYTYPPANNFGTVRIDRGYVASRLVFELTGALTSCRLSQGTVAARGLDFHTLGCRTTGGRLCSDSESDHLDTNAPRFALSTGTFTMVKVAGGASCADVARATP
jgi:hypothetical protein